MDRVVQIVSSYSGGPNRYALARAGRGDGCFSKCQKRHATAAPNRLNLRSKAAIEDLRIHDLRHTCATQHCF